MKLQYYLDKKGNKIYTLKQTINSKQTKSAHYKYKKTKDVVKSK